MFKILFFAISSALTSRQQLVLENIALRHQIQVFSETPSDQSWSRQIGYSCLCFQAFSRIGDDTCQSSSRIRLSVGIKKAGDFFWRWKSKPGPGRPKVPAEVRTLIRRMSQDNHLWGAPRIHGELLKLGYDICESTIAKYMVRRPSSPSQTWRKFIRNHMSDIAAVDFFTVHTATFRTLYVFLVLSLDRRRVVHFNVTTNPTSEWTSLQLTQAFPFDSSPQYLIRDRDGIYGQKVIDTINNREIKPVLISHRSPWQNGYCERVIGSIRRECLDFIIVLNERHLRRVLKEYFAFFHESRTHLGLEKDTPVSRPIQTCDAGPLISEPVLGGLHHRYYRDAA